MSRKNRAKLRHVDQTPPDNTQSDHDPEPTPIQDQPNNIEINHLVLEAAAAVANEVHAENLRNDTLNQELAPEATNENIQPNHQEPEVNNLVINPNENIQDHPAPTPAPAAGWWCVIS